MGGPPFWVTTPSVLGTGPGAGGGETGTSSTVLGSSSLDAEGSGDDAGDDAAADSGGAVGSGDEVSGVTTGGG